MFPRGKAGFHPPLLLPWVGPPRRLVGHQVDAADKPALPHSADGTELWRLDLGEDLTASPVYARGRLIIGGGKGTLFVIAPSK